MKTQNAVVAVEAFKPQVEKLAPDVMNVVKESQGIVIKDHKGSESAGMFLSAIRAMRKKVAELCDPVCQATDAAHKAAVKVRKSLDGPLEQAETSVKSKLNEYHTAQERLRLAEQRRLQEIENEKARRKAADEAALMEAVGDIETAEAIIAAPVMAKVMELAPVTAPENVSFVSNWKWRKTAAFDISKVPPEYLMLNETMINQLAKAMKDQMRIPGLEAYDAGSVRVGG